MYHLILTCSVAWVLLFSSFTSASLLVPLETETEIASASSKLHPHYEYKSTDPIHLERIVGVTPTELDGAWIQGFSINNPSYFKFDTSAHTIIAHSNVGNIWRTFRATSVVTSWNSETNLVLTEYIRDGVTSPSSPLHFNPHPYAWRRSFPLERQ